MDNEQNYSNENKTNNPRTFSFDNNYQTFFSDSGDTNIINADSRNYSQQNQNANNFPGNSFKEPEPVAEEQTKKKSVGLGTCIAVSAVSTVIGCIIVAVVLLFVGGVFDKNGTGKNPSLNSGIVQSGEDTVVSGTVINPGSNVTINVDSDSLANAVYAKVNQSVVGIRVVTASSYAPWASETYTIAGEGSGIVYSEDGIIVTNHHVIRAALDKNGKINSSYQVRVYLDTSLETYSLAELKGFDAATDLAVLKINITGLTPLKFADASKIEIGEDAFVVGSPGGLEFMNSISSGIVSGLNRNIKTEDGIAYNLIQTTAAINPGNSGGAMLNADGELLGICVIKLVSTGYENMGFAISADTVENIVAQILTNGKVSRAALGIRISNNYTATEAAQYGMPVGVWVYSVTDDSAADDAGIKPKDIIVAINDAEISSFYDLRTELLKYKPGESIKVKVYRDGKYLTVNVVLDEMEE